MTNETEEMQKLWKKRPSLLTIDYLKENETRTTEQILELFIGNLALWIADFEPKLEALLTDRRKLEKLIEDFPKCEECEIFQQMKTNVNRALVCETARACGVCEKDKWFKRLELLTKK